jgi:hypothetical protein
MEQAIEPKFSCGACGRTFRWKPAIADKKAKCACGALVNIPISAPATSKLTPKVVVTTAVPPRRVVAATMTASKPASPPLVKRAPAIPAAAIRTPPVPTPPTVAPPPAPSTDEDNGQYDLADDALSQLGSLMPSAEAIAAAQRQTPQIPAAPVAAQPLEYRRPEMMTKAARPHRIDPSTGELVDPFRDFIAPAILLSAGLAGIAIFVMEKLGTGPLGLMAMYAAFAIVLAVTLVKTVVLTAAAVPLAALCDVNVGLLRTAIFKFAATILFGDVAIIWLMVAMQQGGMISKRDDGGPLAWIVYAVALAIIYHAGFLYLFRLSLEEIKFASLMALVSRLCNFFLWLIALALVTSIIANRAQATAPPVPAIRAPLTIAPGTPMTVQPGQISPTALDTLISQRIKQNPRQIMEGYAWCRTGAADNADKKLISDIYNAGAGRVYMDGFTMYAALPVDPAKRAACLDVAHAFRLANGMVDNAATNSLNYQYVVINLLPERLKGLHH